MPLLLAEFRKMFIEESLLCNKNNSKFRLTDKEYMA